MANFAGIFGKNIYLDNKLVGYINTHGEVFVANKKIGEFEVDGTLYRVGSNYEICYIEDNGDIYSNDEEVGYVDSNNNVHFYLEQFQKALKI